MDSNNVNNSNLFSYGNYIDMLKEIFKKDGTTLGEAFLYKDRHGDDAKLSKDYISKIFTGKRSLPEKLYIDETLDNLLEFVEETYSKDEYISKIEKYVSDYNDSAELIKKLKESSKENKDVLLKSILKKLYHLAKYNWKHSDEKNSKNITNNSIEDDICKFNLIKPAIKELKKKLNYNMLIKNIDIYLVELMDEISISINNISFVDDFLEEILDRLANDIENFNHYLATKFVPNQNASLFILNKSSITSLEDFNNTVKYNREYIIHTINSVLKYVNTYELSIDWNLEKSGARNSFLNILTNL